MSHVAWPEIKSFHVVRGDAVHHPEILGGRTTVEYRPKVKLHGRNGAVQVRGDRVLAQSRTQMVTADGDNDQMRSFAAWVESRRARWIETTLPQIPMIYFGEWCGPGIMQGTAVNAIPEKIFAVFAAAELRDDSTPLVVDPAALEILVEDVPGTYVLPWYGELIQIPMLETEEVLAPILDGINAAVAAVEARDPWVYDEFGVDGVGEGLVYYPRGRACGQTREGFSDLVFKAKGKKHEVVAQRAPAQVEPEVAASAEAYAALVLTDARLEQWARDAGRERGGQREDGGIVFEKRLVGPFLAGVCGDVEKETPAERAASGLSWKQVQRAVSDRARRWYLEKTERA